MRRSGEQAGRFEIFRRADLQAAADVWPLIKCTLVRSIKQFSGEGLCHHAGDGLPVLEQPGEGPPYWQSGYECPCAVNWIDNPHMAAICIEASHFLAQYTVF